MSSDQVEIEVAASPEAVWAVVGDFWAIGDFMAGIESCRREGDDERVLVLGGNEIRERLVSRDEAARSIRYSIVAGVPVEQHEAVITLSPSGEGTQVTWQFEVLPDQLAPVLAATYSQGLKSLRRHFA